MPAIFLCRSAGAKKTNTRRKPIGYSTERKENTFADDKCRQCGIQKYQPRRITRIRSPLRRLPVRLAGHVSTFSVAGQRLGFADERGTLFHEICALREQSYWHEARHPKYLLLENVPGLLTHEGGQTSSLSSPRLGNWGILLNGVLLTAQTSVSPKTGSECTLSDILIADCPAKYILSEEAHIQILSSLFPDAKVSVYIPPMEPPYV